VTRTPDDSDHYRYVMSHYPTGVTLVTAREPDGTALGMVVGSFTSVSLRPPLVAFLPSRRSTTWPRIRVVGRFCANILGAGQDDVCRAFVGKVADRFERYEWRAAGSGSPLLCRATAWVDCEVASVVDAGDHHIVLARVRELGVGEPAGLPLIFLHGRYLSPRRLPTP